MGILIELFRFEEEKTQVNLFQVKECKLNLQDMVYL